MPQVHIDGLFISFASILRRRARGRARTYRVKECYYFTWIMHRDEFFCTQNNVSFIYRLRLRSLEQSPPLKCFLSCEPLLLCWI